MQKALRFSSKGQEEFIKVLRKRVNQYFQDKNISTYANTEQHIKSVALILLWAGSYALIVFGGLPLAVTYVLWAVLGVSIALVATNVGHDAIHGAYSKHKWVNHILGHTFNLNGASAYMWKKMHNVAHHTYTNIHGYDEDIESVPVIRLSPKTPLKKVHRYQHIYSFLFYGLGTISWAFIKDYVKFFKNEVGNYSGGKHPRKEYFYLFFYKALNYTIFLVLPLVFMEFAWYQILLGYFIMHYCAGFYLAIVFMLAHVVEKTHFPEPDHKGTVENSWAIHQLYTTANFSRKSRLAQYLTGGLNLQVEHHLFPNVCSIHYRKLSEIVKETAEEHNLLYLEEPTFFKALQSHVSFLKNIGREEDYKPAASKLDSDVQMNMPKMAVGAK